MAEQSTERVMLYVRGGCHLCEPAREVVARVAGQLGVTWREVDIDGRPELQGYADQVPVVTVDGVVHACWQVPEDRLRRALGS